MCDRGREKGVGIGGGGERVDLDIVTDPRCDKRIPCCVFRRLGTRGICEMVSDGSGRFIPTDIVGVHTLSSLLSSQVAHDRATEDNLTQQTESLRTNVTRNETTRGYSTQT